LTKDQAIKYLFPEASKIEKKTRELKPLQKRKVRKICRSKMIKSSYDLYICKKDGKKIGTIIFVSEQGKHDLILVAVGITTRGNVKKVAVCASNEDRGQAVAKQGFLKQFINKSVTNQLIMWEDIIEVTGATISGTAVAKAVKKALAIYTVFR
jgi:Na+-translocating ferredoxin:NAD+ oxidoreductase RnfG subunit